MIWTSKEPFEAMRGMATRIDRRISPGARKFIELAMVIAFVIGIWAVVYVLNLLQDLLSGWCFLPVAFALLLPTVKLAPPLLRPAARALVLRAFYGSLFLSGLFILINALRNVVKPSWLRNAETFVFDHRNILDEVVFLRPLALVPTILFAGAISYSIADVRLIRSLNRLVSVTGHASLLLYTLSFFTLFTVIPTQYVADQVSASTIPAYKIAFDAAKKSVGRYIAAQAVQEFTAAPETRKSFADLRHTVVSVHNDLSCTTFCEAATTTGNPGCTRLSISTCRSLASVRSTVIVSAIDEVFPDHLSGIPATLETAVALPIETLFKTRAEYEGATQQAQAIAKEADARVAVMSETIQGTLDSLLDLAPILNEYEKDALSEILDALSDKYLVPLLDRLKASGLDGFVHRADGLGLVSSIQIVLKAALPAKQSLDELQKKISDATTTAMHRFIAEANERRASELRDTIKAGRERFEVR